jgi:hypothetical protein
MQLKVLNTTDMAHRVQGFLDAQGAAIGVAVPADLRARLDGAVTQLVASQTEQGISAGAAKTATAIRKDVKTRLLRPIARVAKSALKNAPDIAALIMPSGSMANGTFVSKLNSLADAATAHEKVFVDHMLPADFIAQLKAASAQLTASVESRARSIARRRAATASMIAAEKVIKDSVSVLNHVLTPLLKPNAALLADWVASKRVQQTVVNPISTGNATPAVVTADPTQQQPAAAPVVPAAPASTKPAV